MQQVTNISRGANFGCFRLIPYYGGFEQKHILFWVAFWPITTSPNKLSNVHVPEAQPRIHVELNWRPYRSLSYLRGPA